MQPPHHVLSHIEDIVTVGPLHDRHGFDLLHDTDVLVGLCHQLAARCGQFLSRHPFVVGLISGFVPPRQFVEGIVFLTVELVVRDDRPRAVACHVVSVTTNSLVPSLYSISNCASRRGTPKPRIPGLRIGKNRPLPRITPIVLFPNPSNLVTSYEL